MSDDKPVSLAPLDLRQALSGLDAGQTASGQAQTQKIPSRARTGETGVRLAGALAVMAIAACSQAPSFNEIDKVVAACQLTAAKVYPRSDVNHESRYYIGDVAETVKTCMRGQGFAHGGGAADKRCFSSEPVGSSINSYCYHPTNL